LRPAALLAGGSDLSGQNAASTTRSCEPRGSPPQIQPATTEISGAHDLPAPRRSSHASGRLSATPVQPIAASLIGWRKGSIAPGPPAESRQRISPVHRLNRTQAAQRYSPPVRQLADLAALNRCCQAMWDGR
jgi:hypothetical protein